MPQQGAPPAPGARRVLSWFARHPARSAVVLGMVILSLAPSSSPVTATLVSALGPLAFGVGLIAAPRRPTAEHGLFDAAVEDGREHIGVVVVPAGAVPRSELVAAAARPGSALGVRPLVVTASPCSRGASGLAAVRSLGLWDRRRLAREVDRAGPSAREPPGSLGGDTPRVLAPEVLAGPALPGRARSWSLAGPPS